MQLLGAPDNELPTEIRETEPNPFVAGNTISSTQLNNRCNRARCPWDPPGEHLFSEVELTAYANESDVPITMDLFLDPSSAVSKIGGDVSVRVSADFSPLTLASPCPGDDSEKRKILYSQQGRFTVEQRPAVPDDIRPDAA